MLTPQAVADRTFSKAKFGGYQMQEVDDFLDEITKDYRTLTEENATLNQNLKILAAKINEYRETEDIMRATLHNAQRTANEIVAEAESKREAILDALEQDIRARKQAYDDEIAQCRRQLAEARQQVTEYVATIQELTDRQQAFLANLPDLGQGDEVELPTSPAPEEEAPAPAAQEPAQAPQEDSIGEMIAQEAEAAPPEEDAPAQPEAEEDDMVLSLDDEDPEPPAEQHASNTSRIDFSNLKFGKDYQIK